MHNNLLMRAREKRHLRPEKIAWLFLLPSLLTLVLFTIIPMCASVVISFLKIDISFANAEGNGVTHFLNAFGDERFWNAMKNSLVFAAFEVPVQVILGLLVANSLASSGWFSRLGRTVFFIPVVCSMAAIGITFSLLLDGTIGMMPYLIKKYLGIGNVAFFRDPVLAMPTVIGMTVWKNFGYTMSILVVGINAISRSLFEAAQIDGASKYKQFVHVTLPGIRASLGFCLITNLIGSLQVFDQVYVTTQGGPQFKTETMVQYIYKTGFSSPFNLGYASAMSTLMMIVILVLSIPLYLKLFVPRKAD